MPRRRKTQAPRAPTGQVYGQAGQQLAAQRAIPLPDNTALPPAVPGPPTNQPALPGGLGAFTRPTERPAEPVTAGAPAGPGPGPLQVGIGTGDAVVDLLSAAYQAFGSEEIRGMLEEVQTRYGDR